MTEEQPLNFYYRFNPCMHCSNAFTKECVSSCTPEGKYANFELRSGTGIKDLPAFPIFDMMAFPDPYFRMITLSIYIAAITDYLQHEDDYKFREEAAGTETKIPDFMKLFDRRLTNGRNPDTQRSSRVSEDQ